MPQIAANALMLEVEEAGPPGGEPLLLIAGLGTQLTRWSPTFVEALAAEGFRVIRFDNRDMGLSQKVDHLGLPDMPAIFGALAAGQRPTTPYTLWDMAADVVGLMDTLGIAKAHLAGTSMGGMIAQIVAVEYPQRVLSLTSIMSTTGNPDLPKPLPAAAAVLSAPPPASPDFEALVERGMTSLRAFSSPGFPFDEALQRENLKRDMLRGFHPPGLQRQSAAVMTAGDRRAALRTITTPTAVVHGVDDPLVPVACGEDTHASIPGSVLTRIDGMGHEIHAAVQDRVVAAIAAVAARARAAV
ncbi:MAG: alpha/beta hydrolase [Phenylobacterium sp.]|nr:alpha/beta hydrolase [Phenylobacterium sp.]